MYFFFCAPCLQIDRCAEFCFLKISMLTKPRLC